MVPKYYTKEDDALVQDWSDETVWVSPPWMYKEMLQWLKKCQSESRQNGATVVGIFPIQDFEPWWDKYAMTADEIRYIDGSLNFKPMWNEEDYDGGFSVQPHCLIIWYGEWDDEGRAIESKYPNK
jgi:site-specific DNA-methyltransferase (adenine-specific)